MPRKSEKESSAQATNRAWSAAVIIALVVGFFLLRAYLGVIILAMLMAFLFYPTFVKLTKKTKRQSLGVLLTTLLSTIAVAAPVIVILVLAVSETKQLVDNLSANSLFVSGSQASLESQLVSAVDSLNSLIESVVGSEEAISVDGVKGFMESTLPAVLQALSNALIGIVSGIPTFVTLSIIYFFVFVEGLTNGPAIIKTIKDLSPFDDKVNTMYVHKVGAMAKAMVKGQMLIALCQGLASSVVLSLVGFSEYFWVMSVLFIFMSFIPLGAGIITIPIGIMMILFGNFAGGVIVLLNHFVVVTNIDNYIRPKVVPDDARLSASLTLISAFAGVGYFGFLGVIYGPIIMIVVTTTISSYIGHKNSLQTAGA